LRKASQDPEAISCPHCRRRCAYDDIEIVPFTAQQQWDELLEVAKDFAEMDRRGEQETSEEEAEENFIDDENPDARRYDDSAGCSDVHDCSEMNLIPVCSSEQSEAPAPDCDRAAELSDLDDDRPLVTPPPAATTRVNSRVVQSSDDETTAPYSQSPVKTKRERMQQLARERQKRRRL